MKKYYLHALEFDLINHTYYVEENIETLYKDKSSDKLYDEYGDVYADSIKSVEFDFYTNWRGAYYFILKQGESLSDDMIEEALNKAKSISLSKIKEDISRLENKYNKINNTTINLTEWKHDE